MLHFDQSMHRNQRNHHEAHRSQSEKHFSRYLVFVVSFSSYVFDYDVRFVCYWNYSSASDYIDEVPTLVYSERLWLG